MQRYSSEQCHRFDNNACSYYSFSVMNMFLSLFSLMGKKADVLERFYTLDKAVKKRKTQTK